MKKPTSFFVKDKYYKSAEEATAAFNAHNQDASEYDPDLGMYVPFKPRSVEGFVNTYEGGWENPETGQTEVPVSALPDPHPSLYVAAMNLSRERPTVVGDPGGMVEDGNLPLEPRPSRVALAQHEDGVALAPSGQDGTAGHYGKFADVGSARAYAGRLLGAG
jgi:hypothetical protein